MLIHLHEIMQELPAMKPKTIPAFAPLIEWTEMKHCSHRGSIANHFLLYTAVPPGAI